MFLRLLRGLLFAAYDEVDNDTSDKSNCNYDQNDGNYHDGAYGVAGSFGYGDGVNGGSGVAVFIGNFVLNFVGTCCVEGDVFALSAERLNGCLGGAVLAESFENGYAGFGLIYKLDCVEFKLVANLSSLGVFGNGEFGSV